MKKIVFIAKTDLNVDGRILNQIKILKNANVLDHLDFILLPDKPYQDTLDYVKVYNLESRFRKNPIFRIFTVLDTTIKSIKLLSLIKPDILHVQDTAVVLPALIYRWFNGSRFKLIYDDHELPNENESIQYKIYQFFEKLLMKKSDLILFANKERMELVVKQFNLNTKVDYFLNLPYFENSNLEIANDPRFLELDRELSRGTKLIMHQGSLEVERGREKLAKFSTTLPNNFKILVIGVSKEQFEKFINEYNLDVNHFYFFGTVSYHLLDQVWSKCIGSIVMYLPTYINNRLCAPNRMYISLKHGLPVIINKDNPVLHSMVKSLNCGYFIEDFEPQQFYELKKENVFSRQLNSLIEENKIRLSTLYKEL